MIRLNVVVHQNRYVELPRSACRTQPIVVPHGPEAPLLGYFSNGRDQLVFLQVPAESRSGGPPSTHFGLEYPIRRGEKSIYSRCKFIDVTGPKYYAATSCLLHHLALAGCIGR